MTSEGKTTVAAAERAGQGAPATAKSKKRATTGKKAPKARPGAKGAKPKGDKERRVGRRSARGEQSGQGPGPAEPEGRGDAGTHHEGDRAGRRTASVAS